MALIVAAAACGPDSTPRSVTFPDTGAVEGQVLARDGSRVPPTGLALTAGAAARSTETDAGGVYAFQGVVPQTWRLELTVPTGWELADGQAAVRMVVVQTDEATREDFILRRSIH